MRLAFLVTIPALLITLLASTHGTPHGHSHGDHGHGDHDHSDHDHSDHGHSDHGHDGLSKADIAVAVAEGLGTAIDGLALKMDRILTRLPGFTPPPKTEPPKTEPEVNVTFFEILDDFASNELQGLPPAPGPYHSIPKFIDNPPLGPAHGELDADVVGPNTPPGVLPHHLKRPHSKPHSAPTFEKLMRLKRRRGLHPHS